MTDTDYKHKLKDKGFEALETFKGVKTKILHKHIECGHEWLAIPEHFLYRNGKCPNCVSNKKLTQEEYERRLLNTEYMVLGNYVNVDIKVLHRHKACGHEWEISPYSLSTIKSCPKCKIETLKKANTLSSSEYKDRLITAEYESLEEYKGIHSKILHKHIICGHEWYCEPNSILGRSPCPKCSNSLPITTETYKDRLINTEYEVLEEYTNSNTLTLHKHKICGNVWKIRPNNLLRGYGCPVCASSKGEQKVQAYLVSRNFNFTTQYIIRDCKDKQPLRFDFAVFTPALALIEFDGIQHFKSVDYFGGSVAYEELKRRDSIKDTYCKDNNITLIRISYKDLDNIEKILRDRL